MVVGNRAAGVLVGDGLRQVREAASQRQLRSRTRDKAAEGDQTLVAGDRAPGVVLQIRAEADRIRVGAMLEGHNRRGHSRVVHSRVVRILEMVEADRRIGDARHRAARAGTSVRPTGAICTSITSGFCRT